MARREFPFRIPTGKSALGLLFLLASFSGCCLIPSPTPPDLSHLTALEAVQVHTEREAAVHTLQGEIWADLDSPKRSGGVRGDILVKRPNAFRMVASRRFAGTIFDLVVRKDRVEFYVVNEDTLFIQPLKGIGKGGESGKEGGDGSPDLDALFGTTGLARLILGAGSGGEVTFRFQDRAGAGLQLALVNPHGLVEGHVWLDPETLLKRRQVVYGGQGKIELDLEFRDYGLHEKTGVWWPRIIKIHAPRKEFRMEMRFNMGDLVLNQSLENDLFEIDVPEGVKRVERK
ncbi:MAG: hypothetical protein ACYTHM_02920 [Planctomycetota bacterium]|jgi:outer membrane lipoprotein-sorting protein